MSFLSGRNDVTLLPHQVSVPHRKSQQTKAIESYYLLLGLQIAGNPAKWSGLYALGFGLILLLWAGKLLLDLTVLRGRNQKLGSTGFLDRLQQPSRSKKGSSDSSSDHHLTERSAAV